MKKFEEKLNKKIPVVVLFQHSGEQNETGVNELAEKLGAKYGERIHIMSMDCSHNGEFKARYKFKEYPTWIVFKEGQELMRLSGHKSEAELVDMIERAF